MTDFSNRTNDEIEQWIINHETKGVTDVPLYRELLEERARRGEERNHLKIEASLALLRQVAAEARCIANPELAKASGVDWAKARHRMNRPGGHLDHLLDVCHVRGLPLLPALCVNQQGLEQCQPTDAALRVFAEGGRRLGYDVEDERQFHEEQREACWAWGKNQQLAETA